MGSFTGTKGLGNTDRHRVPDLLWVHSLIPQNRTEHPLPTHPRHLLLNGYHEIIRFIKAIRCFIAARVVGALVAMSKPCMVPLVSFSVTSMPALRRSSAASYGERT